MENVISKKTVLVSGATVVFLSTGISIAFDLFDSNQIGSQTLGTFFGSLISSGVIYRLHKKCNWHYKLVKEKCIPLNWLYGAPIAILFLGALMGVQTNLTPLIVIASLTAISVNSFLFIFPLVIWGRIFGELKQE